MECSRGLATESLLSNISWVMLGHKARSGEWGVGRETQQKSKARVSTFNRRAD